MSSALVRQALELVDPEESVGKRGKRRSGQSRRGGSSGQGTNPYKRNKKPNQKDTKTSTDIAEENIKKLLALSTPAVDKKTAEKIVERAIKGKPLAEKLQGKTDDGKSILFPTESFQDFENELFCS
ncbi:hypothetical protein ABMA28_010002 [Loxostege sticticalis]|uniref:40S ribosomal protein S19-binding protein 1 n=1 Tax=Loxostege sticticalis TaxID=481309 RepID=A0ABD0S9C7_LOXSC